MTPEQMETYLMQVAPVETDGARTRRDFKALLSGAAGVRKDVSLVKVTPSKGLG